MPNNIWHIHFLSSLYFGCELKYDCGVGAAVNPLYPLINSLDGGANGKRLTDKIGEFHVNSHTHIFMILCCDSESRWITQTRIFRVLYDVLLRPRSNNQQYAQRAHDLSSVRSYAVVVIQGRYAWFYSHQTVVSRVDFHCDVCDRRNRRIIHFFCCDAKAAGLISFQHTTP